MKATGGSGRAAGHAARGPTRVSRMMRPASGPLAGRRMPSARQGALTTGSNVIDNTPEYVPAVLLKSPSGGYAEMARL